MNNITQLEFQVTTAPLILAPAESFGGGGVVGGTAPPLVLFYVPE